MHYSQHQILKKKRIFDYWISLPFSCSHLNAVVRKCTAQHLANLVDKVGAVRLLSGGKDITDRILPAVTKLAQDSSQEARYVETFLLLLLLMFSSRSFTSWSHCTSFMFGHTYFIKMFWFAQIYLYFLFVCMKETVVVSNSWFMIIVFWKILPIWKQIKHHWYWENTKYKNFQRIWCFQHFLSD